MACAYFLGIPIVEDAACKQARLRERRRRQNQRREDREDRQQARQEARVAQTVITGQRAVGEVGDSLASLVDSWFSGQAEALQSFGESGGFSAVAASMGIPLPPPSPQRAGQVPPMPAGGPDLTTIALAAAAVGGVAYLATRR